MIQEATDEPVTTATTCNLTAVQSNMEMDSQVYNLVMLIPLCVSCSLNYFLSIPLLLAITRSPSLLRHTRFLLLTHLICCDNLQLLALTTEAALMAFNQIMPLSQCIAFASASKAFSTIALLLNTALALDRFVAIKWPLRYSLLVCRRRKILTMVVTWTLPFLFSTVALCMTLNNVLVNASLPRCRSIITDQCMSGHSAMKLFCTVVSGVILPLCYTTIVSSFCLLCWDLGGGLLCTKRAGVTLALQSSQTVIHSVPLILDSFLIPGWMHCDHLDIVANATFNLGISLIPLVYGYRSRELQYRILHFAPRNQVSTVS